MTVAPQMLPMLSAALSIEKPVDPRPKWSDASPNEARHRDCLRGCPVAVAIVAPTLAMFNDHGKKPLRLPIFGSSSHFFRDREWSKVEIGYVWFGLYSNTDVKITADTSAFEHVNAILSTLKLSYKGSIKSLKYKEYHILWHKSTHS